MIKLYHCQRARSMRPLWALEEMGLDYELVTLQFPPRVFHKEYKEVNPLGTVPALIDGEVMLTESAACCQYLAERYGPTELAVRPDEPDYGLWLNWLHRSDATLTFPQTLVLRYSRLEPEERRNPQVVEDYRLWYLGRLRSVEAALADRDWLCAGRFTMADICIGYCLVLSAELGIEEAFTPAIRRWYERLAERPAFQRAHTL
ncbi:glutathione S-transferase family protein [Marinibaculum pumilum]|uniref:Glutathione S-transferase family protein n=1 Tax=Marinibaculum pumilum TaxID=1766165 RepID=A0ABV7KVA0_9PROT